MEHCSGSDSLSSLPDEEEEEEDDDDNFLDSESGDSCTKEAGKVENIATSYGRDLVFKGDRVMGRRSSQQAPSVGSFCWPESSGLLEASPSSANGSFTPLPNQQELEKSRNSKEDFTKCIRKISTPHEVPQSALTDGFFKASKESSFDRCEVNDEVSGLFRYIDLYKPKMVELNTFLKPFIPEYIPAIGSVDDFIKVPRPDGLPDHLGLKVLDECGPIPSDPAVITLQLRAASLQFDCQNCQVASIQNAEKYPKKLDAWIHSIKDLYRMKPSQSVSFSRPMPDINRLMQEWPRGIQQALRETRLPTSDLDVDLNTFVDICCSILDIPVYESRVESLHLMFLLYLELKSRMTI